MVNSLLEEAGWKRFEGLSDCGSYSGRVYTLIKVNGDLYYKWGFHIPDEDISNQETKYFFFESKLAEASDSTVKFYKDLIQAGGKLLDTVQLPVSREELNLIRQSCKIYLSIMIDSGQESISNELKVIVNRLNRLEELF